MYKKLKQKSHKKNPVTLMINQEKQIKEISWCKFT